MAMKPWLILTEEEREESKFFQMGAPDNLNGNMVISAAAIEAMISALVGEEIITLEEFQFLFKRHKKKIMNHHKEDCDRLISRMKKKFPELTREEIKEAMKAS